MSEQGQRHSKENKRPKTPRVEPTPTNVQVGEPLPPVQLPSGPLATTGDDLLQRQVVLLNDRRLQPVQRQALAIQFGRGQGNRHLRRVMAAVQRDGDENQQTKIQRLDEMLDRFDVPEEAVITLLGQLDQPEKNTVLSPANGYKQKLADAMNVGEMVRAVNNLTIGPWNPRLSAKLAWVWAVGSASSIDYANIRPWITAATTPAEQKTELRNGAWRSFFADVCTNETMRQALADLGFDLATKIRWLAAEMSLSYDDIAPLITAPGASVGEKNALKTEAWRDYFVGLCTNATMAQLVNQLGFDLATKLDWMIAEGTDLDLVAAAIRTAPDPELTGVTSKPALMRRLREELGDDDFQMASRMLSQGLLAEETDVERDLSETLLVGDPATEAFSERDFGGTAGFDIAYYRDRLQITVRVALNPVDDTARTQLATVQPIWKSNIEGAWNVFQVTNGVHTLPVKIECNFTTSNPHHEVDVHPGTPTGWPGVDMTNWYTGKLISPNHEFGHMLGNPDEYFLSAEHFQEVTGIDPATAAPGAVTSETDTEGNTRYANPSNIMGISSQPAQPRHLIFFLNWLNNHRRAGEARYRLI